jgi:hypothetical protein
MGRRDQLGVGPSQTYEINRKWSMIAHLKMPIGRFFGAKMGLYVTSQLDAGVP